MYKTPSSLITVGGGELSFKAAHKEFIFPCATGKSGFTVDKREGDGCTPLGIFPLRECWYRHDKLAAPKTLLPLQLINEEDGWCDEPSSPHYNRPVKLPYSLSHERLWREDDVYDIVVPLGYNDDPVIPGKGSAIFMHLARLADTPSEPDNSVHYEPTEGCIALARADMLELLAHCGPDTLIEITKE